MQSNGFFTAIPWKAKGGGQLAVMKVNDFTKFQLNDPMLKGHKAPISDFQFNPFVDNFLATASEDGTAAFWTIPVEGLIEDLKTPNATLYGHSKKITHLKFNPTAQNVMATASFDQDVRIWDVSQAKESLLISGLIGQPTCAEWNHDGSLLAVVDKKKKLNIFDPRDTASASHVDTIHNGPKQMKCCWLGHSNNILTTGTNKQMFKEVGVWDSRDLSAPLKIQRAEKNLEVSDPFFDPVSNLAYLAVKGEARVNVWELTGNDEVITQVATWKGDGSHRGFNFFPKRFVDVFSSELMRGIRLTDKFCEYVSFGLPKKRGAFVPSLYGKCDSGQAVLTFDQWSNGESGQAIEVDLNPDLIDTLKLRTEDGSVAPATEEESKETPDNSEEVEELKAHFQRKITDLEGKLKVAEESVANTQNNEETEELKSQNSELTHKVSGLEEKISELEKKSTSEKEEFERILREKDQEIARLLASQQNPITEAIEATTEAVSGLAQSIGIEQTNEKETPEPENPYPSNAEEAQAEDHHDEEPIAESSQPTTEDLLKEVEDEDNEKEEESAPNNTTSGIAF